MARIIRFTRDRHEEVRVLLPWYVTGRLDADERARLEAHLRDCPGCQAALRQERQLASAACELPLEADQGWTELRQRIEAQAEPRPLRRIARMLAAPGLIGWTLVAQFLVAVLIVGLAAPISQRPRYHALGAPPPPAAVGDAVVIFRPEAKVAEFSRALRASGARLVDGPTEADAYVLAIPLERRSAALARLRADSAVALAEPLEPAERP